jgi:hypothetical protein
MVESLLNTREYMTHLTPSASHPGHWRLDGHELVPGDTIEVLLVDTWYQARVQFNECRYVCQLLIGNSTFGIPLLEGVPARWVALHASPEGELWGGREVEPVGVMVSRRDSGQ